MEIIILKVITIGQGLELTKLIFKKYKNWVIFISGIMEVEVDETSPLIFMLDILHPNLLHQYGVGHAVDSTKLMHCMELKHNLFGGTIPIMTGITYGNLLLEHTNQIKGHVHCVLLVLIAPLNQVLKYVQSITHPWLGAPTCLIVIVLLATLILVI
jgi:hypothetical protein